MARLASPTTHPRHAPFSPCCSSCVHSFITLRRIQRAKDNSSLVTPHQKRVQPRAVHVLGMRPARRRVQTAAAAARARARATQRPRTKAHPSPQTARLALPPAGGGRTRRGAVGTWARNRVCECVKKGGGGAGAGAGAHVRMAKIGLRRVARGARRRRRRRAPARGRRHTHSSSVKMSPWRTGPRTFRTIVRSLSSRNSTRTCVTLPVLPVRPRTLRGGRWRAGGGQWYAREDLAGTVTTTRRVFIGGDVGGGAAAAAAGQPRL